MGDTGVGATNLSRSLGMARCSHDPCIDIVNVSYGLMDGIRAPRTYTLNVVLARWAWYCIASTTSESQATVIRSPSSSVQDVPVHMASVNKQCQTIQTEGTHYCTPTYIRGTRHVTNNASGGQVHVRPKGSTHISSTYDVTTGKGHTSTMTYLATQCAMAQWLHRPNTTRGNPKGLCREGGDGERTAVCPVP